MDNRIEGHDACKTRIRYLEGAHVADPEVEVGIVASGHIYHLGREVDADDSHTLLVEVASNMPGSTAKVGNEAATAFGFGKPVQKMTIERLVRKLVRKMLGVCSGCGVVAFANVHGAILSLMHAWTAILFCSTVFVKAKLQRGGSEPVSCRICCLPTGAWKPFISVCPESPPIYLTAR